ncbi:helix-turn-helix domain-containing protein [Chryseobacterium sp. SC28]|uniref:helix-turn-helix domain-containing protein n=1 Tax=Chryseobacterium sp. SC28 TaxID=2268028 RepID=UPI000F64FFDE|nr:helix-turn-helix domain-containing protein [Chryseobacterium sp. SC28]RRQ45671.1 hypothetical protein DTW91_09300 [Chryseobacterium sp. SC28]
MKNAQNFPRNLFEKIFELNSKNKIGANTIAVFTFILYQCEDLQKEIVLSDYQMARELGLSRQTIITAKNKLKHLGLLEFSRNRGFPNRFILKGDELPKKAPKNVETKEIPIKESAQNSEPNIDANHSFSKYPNLKQFMNFAKTLDEYSEKLDDVLIQKFHQWEEADWKNGLGRPILDWQIVLKKNLTMLELFSTSKDEGSFPHKIPNIKRPKLD